MYSPLVTIASEQKQKTKTKTNKKTKTTTTTTKKPKYPRSLTQNYAKWFFPPFSMLTTSTLVPDPQFAES